MIIPIARGEAPPVNDAEIDSERLYEEHIVERRESRRPDKVFFLVAY